jgi:hypothetical protein
MGTAHVILADELLHRIESDPSLSRRIEVLDKKAFADAYTFFDSRGRTHVVSATHRVHIKTEALTEGYHYDLDLIIEDGTDVIDIRFKKDADV